MLFNECTLSSVHLCACTRAHTHTQVKCIQRKEEESWRRRYPPFSADNLKLQNTEHQAYTRHCWLYCRTVCVAVSNFFQHTISKDQHSLLTLCLEFVGTLYLTYINNMVITIGYILTMTRQVKTWEKAKSYCMAYLWKAYLYNSINKIQELHVK